MERECLESQGLCCLFKPSHSFDSSNQRSARLAWALRHGGHTPHAGRALCSARSARRLERRRSGAAQRRLSLACWCGPETHEKRRGSGESCKGPGAGRERLWLCHSDRKHDMRRCGTFYVELQRLGSINAPNGHFSSHFPAEAICRRRRDGKCRHCAVALSAATLASSRSAGTGAHVAYRHVGAADSRSHGQGV